MDGHWLTKEGWTQAALDFGLILPSDYPGGAFTGLCDKHFNFPVNSLLHIVQCPENHGYCLRPGDGFAAPEGVHAMG